MPRITFLSRMSVDEARAAISQFSQEYAADWHDWQASYHIGSNTQAVVSKMGHILRKWQATRPNPMRRPRREATHLAPFLDDLVGAAQPHLHVAAQLTVRDISTAGQSEIDAIEALWSIFENLPYRGRASCVGISKAVLLLTSGKIGPALDKVVRDNLGLDKPASSDEWVECLRAICDDIAAFESRNTVTLTSLVPAHWAPIEVGRVYDMVAGPR